MLRLLLASSSSLLDCTCSNPSLLAFPLPHYHQAVFYLDHNYLESMLAMFRKLNAKERVVGFYSTGPSIRPNDLRIYDIVKHLLHY